MKITIYTTNTCAYCAMVKRYLDGKDKDYEIVNLDEHPERREEAYALSGAFTVPVTAISRKDDLRVIVGWKPAELAAAIS